MQYGQKLSAVFAAMLLTASCGSAQSQTMKDEKPLKISAFKDITAFILDEAQKNGDIYVEIKYVKNATEAHSDLTEQKADMVFMSYDDTLSIAMQENYKDLVAAMPIHGGMLDLCGQIDPDNNKTNVGIDTNTGYARALRAYLKSAYSQSDYAKLHFTFAGATNLRYEKLLEGEIDATLLNPPYSYSHGVKRLYRLQDAFGTYQGVVVNVNKSWLAQSQNEKRLRHFAANYYKTVLNMKNASEPTIQKLQNFYGLSKSEATLTYTRLWESDGLNISETFNEKALLATQKIFTQDSNITMNAGETFSIQFTPSE